MRPTRLSVLCLLAMIGGHGALAGPFEDSILRGSARESYDTLAPAPRYVPGSPVTFRWEGLYFGGQVGRSTAGIDFGNATLPLVSEILRQDLVLGHVSDWTVLSRAESSAVSYGGFIGYNTQWDEAVLGLELNYNRAGNSGISAASADSMSRMFSDDAVAPAGHHYFYSATVAGSASARLTDFGTIRARAGYAMDRFMPYLFGGLALGRVDVFRSATVSYTRTDIPDATTPPALPITPEPVFNFGPVSRSERQTAIAYGYTLGAGIEVAVMPNLFVRGEWEHIQFARVKGFDIHISTFRTGLAWKF